MTPAPPAATPSPVLDAPAIAQAIQLAIAPVFLLTAIGAILGVLTSRLGRVIDRARLLEAGMSEDTTLRAKATAELAILDRRMVLANRAVSLCVMSALFTCVLIATLFIAAATPAHVARFLPTLFVIVMALLIAGLSAFLLEVRIATRTVRVRAEYLIGTPPPPGDFRFPRH